MKATANDSPDLPLNFGGVVPSLAISADLGPPRSELGIGGLMPWNGRLYVVTYVSHKAKSGTGAGLYWIDQQMRMHRCPEGRDGTYANRFIHWESNQLIIGPHLIDPDHNIRTVEELVDIRVCGTMVHLEDPANKVYILGMEGEFGELDVHTLAYQPLDDLTERLGVESHQTAHFKAGYTYAGRVVVANNSYDERDQINGSGNGRLAEWDGQVWRILERTAFVEVAGRGGFSGTMFAMGWDRASVLLKVYTQADDTWRTYRLPKATHCFEHAWQTEWPRIREVEHERFLMDMHGMFYELSPWAYQNRIWGVKPISQHLWVHADFCSWNGMLVLGPDNASPHQQDNVLCAEPTSGLWFGKTDDLWKLGKPQGWGGPWYDQEVADGEVSDPYLMTGFDQKCLHLVNRGEAANEVTMEVDFLGNGAWHGWRSFDLKAGQYECLPLPEGFSAHWIRFRSEGAGRVTAWLVYT